MTSLDPKLRALIVENLGLASLPKQEQDEALALVGDSVLKAVTLALLERLPAPAQEEYKALSEQENGEAARALLEKHISDVDALIREEAMKEVAAFKKAYGQALVDLNA